MAAPGGGSILYVEADQEFAGDLLAIWVPPLRVRLVSSSAEALRELHASAASLVLLGIGPPAESPDPPQGGGWGCLVKIRKEFGPSIPIVVLARDAGAQIDPSVQSLGADAVLPYPVDVADLERTVARLLGGSRRAAAGGSTA